jgi:hypothetical protein
VSIRTSSTPCHVNAFIPPPGVASGPPFGFTPMPAG